MNYYIVRYTNGESDIILTEAPDKAVEVINRAVTLLLKDNSYNSEGLTKTEIIVQRLRDTGFKTNYESNVTEIKD